MAGGSVPDQESGAEAFPHGHAERRAEQPSDSVPTPHGPTERRAAQKQSTPDTPSAVTLSVIAPCLNEEGNVGALCDRVLAVFDRMFVVGASFPPCQGGTQGGFSRESNRESEPQTANHAKLPISAELILIDDGSTDASWQRIEERSRSDARVRGVRHETNCGIVSGWRSGLAAAKGELVCLIDADLQNPPESIESLYQCYERGGVDLVQGAREPVDYVFTRYALSKGLNFLLNRVFGMRLTDNKSGFVLARKDVLRCSLDYRGRYRFAQCFITVFAHARGYRIGEVTTPFHCRHSGQSFLTNLPIRVIVRILWEIARARVEVFTLRRARAADRAEPQASQQLA